jgi:hypothetical protein
MLEQINVVLSSLGLKNGGCCNVIGATLIQGGPVIHPWLLSRHCHPALDAGSMRTPWIPDRAALVRNDRKALYSYKRTAAISTLKCSSVYLTVQLGSYSQTTKVPIAGACFQGVPGGIRRRYSNIPKCVQQESSRVPEWHTLRPYPAG